MPKRGSKAGKRSGTAGAQASRAMTAGEALELCGCDEARYDELLRAKVDRVTGELGAVCELPEAVEVHASPPRRFRQRANFRVWHEPDGVSVSFVMYGAASGNEPLRVPATFDRGDDRINALMPPVLAALNAAAVLRSKCIECRFHTTLRGGAMVLLVYTRPLDDDAEWLAAAEALGAALGDDVAVLGRSHKLRLAASGDARVDETLRVGVDGAERDFASTQLEGEFSQPNGAVCEKMLRWALERTAGAAGDLLELYCGNGNFTVPLASRFGKVLATELSKPNTAIARANAARNGVRNVKVARLLAAEVAEALAPGARAFQRLVEADVDLATYDLRTLLVDPPRAGLCAPTLTLARTFETIVYVSCCPETLADNLHQLAATHEVSHLAVFDQFPYTDHAECGVVLRRKPDADEGAPLPPPRDRAPSARALKKAAAREDRKAANKKRKDAKRDAKRARAEAAGDAVSAPKRSRSTTPPTPTSPPPPPKGRCAVM